MSAARLDRAGNLLGALSLAVSDRTADAIGEAAGQSETAAITLSALHHFLEDPSLDRVRRVLGLTPSGAVGWSTGSRPRATSRGDRDVTAVRCRCASPLGPPCGAAGFRRARSCAGRRAVGARPAERAAYERLTARVLVGLIRGPGAERWMCRSCDMTACGHRSGGCPVANAARERFGS